MSPPMCGSRFKANSFSREFALWTFGIAGSAKGSSPRTECLFSVAESSCVRQRVSRVNYMLIKGDYWWQVFATSSIFFLSFYLVICLAEQRIIKFWLLLLRILFSSDNRALSFDKPTAFGFFTDVHCCRVFWFGRVTPMDCFKHWLLF